jgi:hypothetical protein
VAVVIPLKLVYTPVDATVTAIRNYQVPSTKFNKTTATVGSRHFETNNGLRYLIAHALNSPIDSPHAPHGQGSVNQGVAIFSGYEPFYRSTRRRPQLTRGPDRTLEPSCMLGDPRKNFGMHMHAQWYLFVGRGQMHRAYAPFARWVILATGPQAAFMTGAELSGPASHRIRASVRLTHPCQFAAAHLPCTRPPDDLYDCRPRAHPGLRDRAFRAFVATLSGFQTMPRHDDEDEATEDAASATARDAAECNNCTAGTYLTTTAATTATTCIECPGNTISIAGSDAITDCDECLPDAIGRSGGPCYFPITSGVIWVSLGQFTFVEAENFTVTSRGACGTECAQYINCVGYSVTEQMICQLGGCLPNTATRCSNLANVMPIFHDKGQFSNTPYSGMIPEPGTKKLTDGGVISMQSKKPKCPKGRATPTSPYVTCTLCTAGTYKDSSTIHTNVCTSCGAGKYSTTVGATVASTCISCGIGEYSATVGATNCINCIAGKYTSSTGRSFCTDCIAGTYSTTVGSTVASTCISCGVSKYSTTVGATVASTCIDCGAGKLSTTSGATTSSSCTDCAPKKTSPVGSSSFDACVCSAGHYLSGLPYMIGIQQEYPVANLTNLGCSNY